MQLIESYFSKKLTFTFCYKIYDIVALPEKINVQIVNG